LVTRRPPAFFETHGFIRILSAGRSCGGSPGRDRLKPRPAAILKSSLIVSACPFFAFRIFYALLYIPSVLRENIRCKTEPLTPHNPL
jgi:hypothetical protein